jgi:glycosyltransferase involved in cell wall biosynthesis
MVGRSHDPAAERKREALEAELDLHQLHRREENGALFHLALPFRLARELRAFRPDVVLAQDPYVGAAALLARRLAGVPARLAVDVHGDWRTATRLYGSPLRLALSPIADAVAAFALRRADAVRTVSPFTSRLVREAGLEPTAEFPAWMDLGPFLGLPAPLPQQPTALFVGVLERYKNVDGLVAAWRLVAERLPEARLVVVGKGTLRSLVEDFERAEDLPPHEVARRIDESWVLVLPSRSEGMGRVLIEAFLRGRGVVGSRLGGIADLVEDGVSGLLVEPEPESLADALVRVLSDRGLAERLAEGARATGGAYSERDYAKNVAALVEAMMAR